MRKTCLLKILLASSVLCSAVYGSDQVDDSNDATPLPIAFHTPNTLSGVIEQKFNTLDQTTIKLMSPNHRHGTCDITILEDNGRTFQVTPLMLLACYHGLKADVMNLEQQVIHLSRENTELKQVEQTLRAENALLASTNETLTAQLATCQETVQNAVEKNKNLDHEKDQLKEALGNASATNLFMKQDNANLRNELLKMTHNAENLAQENTTLQGQVHQYEQINRSLLAQLAGMIESNGKLLLSNQNLLARSQ